MFGEHKKEKTESSNLVLDFEYLDKLATDNHNSYVSATPFPHVVIPEFLLKPSLDTILSQIPKPNDPDTKWHFFENVKREDGKITVSKKHQTLDEISLKPYLRQLFWELNSGSFMKFLQKLTGIQDLIPDPYLFGGGIHHNTRGAFLDVHLDFNVHPIFNLDRRLNLLLYLTPNYNEDYGGELELWSSDMKTCEKKIVPTLNTCVIFNTSEKSFHGHPNPVSCPDGMARSSLAMYYYSNDRPEEEKSSTHSTVFQKLPNEEQISSKQIKAIS